MFMGIILTTFFFTKSIVPQSSQQSKEILHKALEEISSEGHQLDKPHQVQETLQAKTKLDAGTYRHYKMCLSWSCCSLREYLDKNWLLSAVRDG